MRRLLDLFCGAGGAAMGYHRAGWEVVGVDINPQPNYPFTFVQEDALTILEKFGKIDYRFGPFDAIHASPPCQAYSVTKTLHDATHPDLVPLVREWLQWRGLPYVIENVQGAPLIDPVRLCGSSFGLRVRRHRLFESSAPIEGATCAHDSQPHPVDVTGTGGRRLGARTDGRGGNSRKPIDLADARDAMGIPWMSRRELSQSIPPAYTEWIGRQL